MYQRFSLKVKLFLFEGFSDSEQLYSDFPSDSSRLFALVGVSDRAQVGRKIERGRCMFPKWVQRFSETTKRSSRQEVKGKRGHGRSAGFHTVSCVKPPVSCVHTREVTVCEDCGPQLMILFHCITHTSFQTTALLCQAAPLMDETYFAVESLITEHCEHYGRSPHWCVFTSVSSFDFVRG